MEHFHSDGTLHARGPMVGTFLHGFWEWFRKDGSRLRSGYFENGVQTGPWTTYDKTGAAYKVTVMKPKPAAKARS